jgi:hypothetical protein
MKKTFLIAFSLLFLLFTHCGFCQTNVRTELEIPDIPGYMTLACDFHMHTVFSDGSVWPLIRPEEAWSEGLDVISITDHIEYLPHKEDIKIDNFNRSCDLAWGAADQRGLLLIRGAEITRDMPPGHFNAIFLQDANALAKDDPKDAIKAGVDQGAFLFWNHPGWRQPGTVPIWHDVHTELFGSGWVKGMEIANDRDYYPKAFQWCLDKNITMLGNSDVHSPVDMAFDSENGEHRPITFVFAKEKTEKAVKEALLAGRTAVYYKKLLLGREQYLKPVFEQSVDIVGVYDAGDSITLQIRNSSCLTLELEKARDVENVTFPQRLALYPGKTIMATVQIPEKESRPKDIVLPYVVTNMLIAPEKGLPVQVKVPGASQK